MIRFCDGKTYWIEYCAVSGQYSLSREALLDYFSGGHEDDLVCVRDSDTMGFVGIITYQSLNRFLTVHEAVRREYLIFNEDIWKNAREYCRRHPYSGTEYLIPVLDQDHQLYCFAYEDLDANREIRILRELTELPDALQFTDVYSEYKCVKIYEFNELAFCFAKYLERLGVSVEVSGSMWQNFFSGQKNENFDYECLTIYAEGIHKRTLGWRANLLRSVSVEFECIDKVYEENIKRGFIKDADGDCKNLIAGLKESLDAVAVIGIDIEAQNTCDWLLKEGIDICCFIFECGMPGRRLLDKPVLSFKECVNKYGNSIIFVDPHEQHSIVGCSISDPSYSVDYLDYLGYERNKKFLLLKDYMQLRGNSLKTVLQNKKFFLIGDICLCEKLMDYYKNKIDGEYKILAVSDEPTCNTESETVDIRGVEKDALILVTVPEYQGEPCEDIKEEKRNIISYLNVHHFESEVENKYPSDGLQVGKIVVGSIEGSSGNYFFKGLLDGHPNIMLMTYEEFEIDLFWFCVRMAGKAADEIVAGFEKMFCSFWRLVKSEWKRSFKDAFIGRLSDLLTKNPSCYTSQQLFILSHIAYMEVYGRNIENIGELIIYWSPHLTTTEIERHVQWLNADSIPCCIVNVVRNSCMSKGSRIKGVLEMNWADACAVYWVVIDRFAESIDVGAIDRIVLRFEDIKCNPQEKLGELCSKLGIPWSEALMSTTQKNGRAWVYDNGRKRIQDFDLTPVYNQYEEYLSEFDRFRIALICASWQKKYGYPYVDIHTFSRRDLQEIFLKDFRFASKVEFESDKRKLDFCIALQRVIKCFIQKEYMSAIRDGKLK